MKNNTFKDLGKVAKTIENTNTHQTQVSPARDDNSQPAFVFSETYSLDVCVGAFVFLYVLTSVWFLLVYVFVLTAFPAIELEL